MYVVETVGDDIDASIAALPAELPGGFAEASDRAGRELRSRPHIPHATKRGERLD